MTEPSSMWSRVFRFRGTVIRKIWWQIVLILLYTTGIIIVHTRHKEIYFNTPILLEIMGVVVALMLAFRTQTSYERYSQGRELWSQMGLQIRNLTRLIWSCVSPHDAQSMVEKKSVINLLLAFAVATKHYLREEYGYKYEDLSSLITHITKTRVIPAQVSQSFREQSFDEVITTEKDLKRNNVPLEISYYITSYINYCRDHRKCDTGNICLMQKALSKLVECLTSFENIIPIPIAYSVHLTHLTWIYTLSIPIQIVKDFQWFTLPITMLAAFAFLGILEIGQEIENPFSYEENDLPLDQFCIEINKEIDNILSHSPINAKEWIFSDKNIPFYPKSLQTAKQLVSMGSDSILKIIKRPQTFLKTTRPGNIV